MFHTLNPVADGIEIYNAFLPIQLSGTKNLLKKALLQYKSRYFLNSSAPLLLC